MTALDSSSRYYGSRMFPPDKVGYFNRPARQPVPIQTASIPSKYKTVVVSNVERKGFTSGTKRFTSQQENNSENPSPNRYIGTKNFTCENVSHSKKGLGSFASGSRRFPRKMNVDIFAGPGHYEHDVKMRNSFSSAKCTRLFQSSICDNKEVDNRIRAKSTPAPTSYNYTGDVIGKTNAKEYLGVRPPPFLSTTKREFSSLKASNPAPNTYETCVESKISVRAPFKSTSKRLVSLSAKTSNPGPADYSPFEKIETSHKKGTGFPLRKHYLCLASPAIPLPPPKLPPGPAEYDLVDYKGPGKEDMSSSMFRSKSKRWNASKKLNDNPGPATYDPQDVPNSFLHNRDSKWL